MGADILGRYWQELVLTSQPFEKSIAHVVVDSLDEIVGFLLHFSEDCVYLPDASTSDEDVYLKYDLQYDGMHYRLPIDRSDQSCIPERGCISIKPTASDTVLPVLSSCPVVKISSSTQTDGEFSMLPLHVQQPVNQLNTSAHDVSSNKFRSLFRECPVALLTGSAPPRLNQSENELFERRQNERESLRPTGTWPALPRGLDVPIWDFLELFAGRASLTTACDRHELLCGPPITWENGYDLENDDHWKTIEHYLSTKHVRILWRSPEFQYWKVGGEKLMLSDAKTLERMYRACEIVSHSGGYFVAEFPFRPDFSFTEVAEKLRQLPGCLPEDQLLDMCQHNL